MLRSEAQLLHERNVNLHASPEVEGVVEYLRANGENIPNEPSPKIVAYMGFLASSDYVNDGVLNGNPESLERQIESCLVQREDVRPEAWIILSHNDEVNQDATDVLVASVREVQRAGLQEWAKQLKDYPQWFRFYAFEELIRLGRFDYNQGKFEERGKGCMVPFPQLEPEALEYVYERVMASDRRSFGQLYSHALDEVSSLSPEERRQQEGTWIKFNRTDDWEESWILGRFYAVCQFKWKELDPEHPQPSPLLSGDYYIYCTPNDDGVHCVPRIGIGTFSKGGFSMLDGIVGKGPNRSLEPEMMPVLHEKLQHLQEAKGYLRRDEDKQILVNIYNKLQDDPDAFLGDNELRLIYQRDYAVAPGLATSVQRLVSIREGIGADFKWKKANPYLWDIGPVPERSAPLTKPHRSWVVRMLGRIVGR